jgi:hypothetical protein
MAAPLRKTGVDLVGDVPWGTHFCQFFETKQDLLDTLLPYFAAGLAERELCLWLVAEPLTTDETESVLRRSVPDLARHLTDGSIEIRPARKWYLKGDALDLGRVIRTWDEKLEEALARGFVGLRISGSTTWLSKRDWSTFTEYEARINESIAGKRMVVLCTYPLPRAEPPTSWTWRARTSSPWRSGTEVGRSSRPRSFGVRRTRSRG